MEKNQVKLIDKFNSAQLEYRKGNYKKAYKTLIGIEKEKKVTKTEDIYEQTEKLLFKIKKIQGLKKSRYILILTTVIVFLTLILGLSIKTKESLVSIDILSDRFSFKLGEDFVSNPIIIKDLDLSGIKNISIPIASLSIAKYDENDSIRWESLISSKDSIIIRKTDPMWSIHLKSDNMVLEDLFITDSSSVTISKAEKDSNQISIIVDDGDVISTIDTKHKLYLACSLCELVYKEEVIPIDGDELMLELVTPQVIFEKLPNSNLIVSYESLNKNNVSNNLHTGKNVLIHSIDFKKNKNGDEISSIVAESSLVFNEFDNRSYKIHTNEFLVLEGLRNFQLTEINLSNRFQLRGTGYVSKTYFGNYLSLKNNMPNYIEWLIENEKVKLLIVVLFPVLSVITAMLYRLKIIDEN